MTDPRSNPAAPPHDLLFGIRRSIRYHTRRRRFFERWHMLTSGVGVIFGSATIASLLTSLSSQIALWTAGVVTVFAAVDLVVGNARMAWLHGDLARRFIALEKELLACDPSEPDYKRLNAVRLDIEMEEPPVLRVLDMLCHNELSLALGYGREHLYKIGWYQRIVAHFFDVNDQAITT